MVKKTIVVEDENLAEITEETTYEELVDRLGVVTEEHAKESARVSELAVEMAKIEEVLFVRLAEEVGDDDVVEVEADTYVAEFSARLKESRKQKPEALNALREELGDEAFFKLVKISTTLADLEKYLPKDKFDEVVEKAGRKLARKIVIKKV